MFYAITKQMQEAHLTLKCILKNIFILHQQN